MLSRFLNGLMIRTFSHDIVLELAQYADIPVINGLTDLLHPCQVLADLQTIREHKGKLAGLKLAFIGDGNNMAHSLMLAGAKTGMEIFICSPDGYKPNPEITAAAQKFGNVTVTDSVEEAAKNANVLYTDVWVSMGEPVEVWEERIAALEEDRRGVEEELTKAREEKNSLANIISGYELRLQSREKKAQDAQEKHRGLQMDQNNLQSRIRMLTEMEKLYEGYSKSVKLVMSESERGGLRGIHGPVAGLLHVTDEYAVAIEIALGNAMQNLVVDTEEDAKKAIGFLKRRDGGRCTFLPLNSVRGRTFQDEDVVADAVRGLLGMERSEQPWFYFVGTLGPHDPYYLPKNTWTCIR